MTTGTLHATQHVAIPEADGDLVAVPGGTPVRAGRLKDGRASFARGTSYRDDDAISTNEMARHIACFPALWEAATHLPNNRHAEGSMGRPLKNPDYVFLYASALVFLFGSQRAVMTYLGDEVTWRQLRKRLNQHRPDGFAVAPKRPPNRNALKYFNRRVEREGIDLDAIRTAVFAAARSQALGMGLLNPDVPLDYAKPNGSQWVNYDGTVFPALSRYRTGDVDSDGRPRRAADGSGLQLKGGDKKVTGLKVMFGSVRVNDYAGRVILDFAQVHDSTEQGVGDEAAYTVKSAKSLAIAIPGMRGITVDSVISGTHHVDLARNGLYAISHTTAKSNPNRLTGGRFAEGREEKTTLVDVFTHKTSKGRVCKHPIHSIGGDLKQSAFDAEGKQVLTSVDVTGFEQVANANGTYRTYLRLKIVCRHGELTPRLPFMHSPRGGATFNRGEYLRFYQPSSDAFTYLYGRRNDTESLHNEIKMKVRRMPAYGKRTQMFLLIGLVIMQNAKTAFFEERRERHRQAEAA